LRIDDLDAPRNVDGVADAILDCLEHFGLHWDDEVYYQSRNLETYYETLNQLRQQQRLYACHCSRKTLGQLAIYPGYCRDAEFSFDEPSAWRLKTEDLQIEFTDALQGKLNQNPAAEHGDFIVRRKDNIIAYQFAVVVDDYRQRVNHVVRGVDLLASTPKQIYQQQLLGYPKPHYMHLPLIVDSQGNKLSKQTLAAPVDACHPETTLFKLLQMLKQNPPSVLQNAPIAEQLSWAIGHWQPQSLSQLRAIEPPQSAL